MNSPFGHNKKHASHQIALTDHSKQYLKQQMVPAVLITAVLLSFSAGTGLQIHVLVTYRTAGAEVCFI
jgi:hypothetical protein